MSSEYFEVKYIGPLLKLDIIGLGSFEKDVPQIVAGDVAKRLKNVKGFIIQEHYEPAKTNEETTPPPAVESNEDTPGTEGSNETGNGGKRRKK